MSDASSVGCLYVFGNRYLRITGGPAGDVDVDDELVKGDEVDVGAE